MLGRNGGNPVEPSLPSSSSSNFDASKRRGSGVNYIQAAMGKVPGMDGKGAKRPLPPRKVCVWGFPLLFPPAKACISLLLQTKMWGRGMREREGERGRRPPGQPPAVTAFFKNAKKLGGRKRRRDACLSPREKSRSSLSPPH